MGLSLRTRSRRSLASLLLLAGLAALLTLALPGAALAAGVRRVGSKPALPSGAQAVGTLAQSTPLNLTVTLQPRDPAALAAYAQEVSTPGTSVYHHYLSVAQFAAQFGPTQPQIAAARQALLAQGLTPGPLAADGLSFHVSASAARLADAFDTHFERYHLPNGRTAYANTSAPQLSGSGASVIQGVIGLDDLAVARPQDLVTHRTAATSTISALPRVSTAPGGGTCPTPADGYTPSDIASAYGFNGLYDAGDTGSGITVALYELEPYTSSDSSDVNAYQKCFGTSTSVTTIKATSTSVTCGGDPECGLEGVLDVENVIGLLPGASVRVYEGTNSPEGALETYERIVSDDAAKVISTSWGECESEVGSSAATSENTLFEEAATQGQSVFAAAGDNGTQDCTDSSGNPTGGPAVDDPASQPYVTGVGGTSLGSISPLEESVWNDYIIDGEVVDGGSGGGGVSTLWSRPSYQSEFARSQSSITCGSGGYTCREVPDVSADADPNTGYAIVWNGQWMPVGGTSAAAPTWASLAALADASAACTTPIGFANPGLYAAAREAYALYFNDVRTGNNNYGGVTGYSAETGYDMASGLGSPKGTALAAALCGSVGDSVKLTSSPKGQTSTAGRAIAPVTILATSNHATPITYSASGLPGGLSINRSSGRVTGTPRKPGRYFVTLNAVDHDGMIATDSLVWTVKAPAVTLRAVSRKTTREHHLVRIVLHATDSVGASLTYRASNLPPGLSINRHTGVISGRPSRKVTRRVTVRALDAYGGSAKRRFTFVVKPRA